MTNVLQDNLNEILQEKESKVLPENIKKGITLFGISGTLTAGEGVMTEEDYEICETLADTILGDALPYIPLEYIQSTGTQWINTGIQLVSTDIVSIDMGDLVMGSEHSIFDASGNYWLAGQYLLCSYNNQIAWCCGSNVILTIPDLTRYTITVQGTGVKVNDTVVRTVGAYTGTVSTLRLMNTENKYGSYKLYGLKILDENNILKHDLIPVKDLSNKVCLYDKVSGEFIYNAGAGEFIAGPEIETVNAELPNAGILIRLESKKNDGSGHINNNTTWTNLATNANIVVNNMTWENGYAYFNGTSTYFDSGVSQNQFLGNATYMLRLKPVEWGNYRGLFGTHNMNSNGMCGFEYEDGQLLYCHLNNTNNAIWLDDALIPVNEWTNLMVVIQNNVHKVYINGEFITESTMLPMNAYSNMIFGRAYGKSDRYYKGYMSHICFYNRALTDDEIKSAVKYCNI